MYAPYLLVNVYTRGALAELMAQALLPFAFWAPTASWRGNGRCATR